jgi:hypothetical protein
MTEVKSTYPLRSVALTCDFLRVQPKRDNFENFQTRNLAWLEQMIGAKHSWPRWGVKTSTLVVPTEANAFKRALGNNGLYTDYQSDPDKTWAALYDAEAVTVFPATFDALLQHDLVVGFELPPTLKRALHLAGKKYISFYIHPVRFLRDLCFLVTTNSNDITNLIASRAVPESEVEFQVRKFSAFFARQQLPALSLPTDVPVLIGQTEKDSALIRKGSFTAWDEYEQELSELLNLYPEIIFLEHPYRDKSASITEYLRGKHGKTVISDRANSYGVIFTPAQIPFFLTLSSSLGTEARCAGWDCKFLHNDPCTKFIITDVDVPRSFMVSHAVLQDEFWKAVFFGDNTQDDFKHNTITNPFSLGDNFIRGSLDSWAFRPLQTGSSIDPVRKLILPSSTIKRDRLKALRDQLTSNSPETECQLSDNRYIQFSWGSVGVLPMPYEVGNSKAMDFTDPSVSHYLVRGFHAPENWGVWSSGKYAKVILPINLSGAVKVKVDIAMTVKVFERLLARAPFLKITVNGKKVSMVRFQASEKNEHMIAFSVETRSTVCTLEFHISRIGSPGLTGPTPDQRELGFALCALSVEVSHASATAALKKISRASLK